MAQGPAAAEEENRGLNRHSPGRRCLLGEKPERAEEPQKQTAASRACREPPKRLQNQRGRQHLEVKVDGSELETGSGEGRQR